MSIDNQPSFSDRIATALEGIGTSGALDAVKRYRKDRRKATSHEQAGNILVGIIEDDVGERTIGISGANLHRSVRPLFEKRDTEWVKSVDHPEEIEWAIAFDGRNRGTLDSHPNPNPIVSAFCYEYTHVPEAHPGTSLTLGRPTSAFSGWLTGGQNRPLVLVAHGHCEDPDRWKPFSPTKKQFEMYKKLVFQEFPRTMADRQPTKWKYQDSNIVLGKCYQSKSRDALVEMEVRLDPEWDEEEGENVVVGMTRIFLVGGDGKGYTLSGPIGTLVDVGDYDGDGKSEAIFFISGYNKDGYVLFYDSFKKHVEYTWGYH